MKYPNKIYCSEKTFENSFGGTSHFVITIAASSMDVAQEYIKEKIGIDVQPVWLMGSVYPTIWNQTGSTPLDVQALILYNGTYHTDFKS